MENKFDGNAASILAVLNYKNIYQKFCDFLKECLFSTLTEPVRIQDFKDLNADKLIDLKRKADLQINEEFKKELNIDFDVGKITSIFESPAFYDDILCGLTNQVRTLTETEDKNTEFEDEKSSDSCNLTESISSDRPVISSFSSVKIYDKECSFKDGHIDLDMSAVKQNAIQISRSAKFLINDKCDCSVSEEDLNLIKPIISSPITKSKFNLVNINFYLSLSQFCGCCQKRLKDKSILHSLNKELDLLKSNVSFDNPFSPFQPYLRKEVQLVNTVQDGATMNVDSCDHSLESSFCENITSDESQDKVMEGNSESNSSASIEKFINDSARESSLDTLNVDYLKTPTESVEKDRLKCDHNKNVNTSQSSDMVSNRSLEVNETLTSKHILSQIYSKYNENLKKTCSMGKSKNDFKSCNDLVHNDAVKENKRLSSVRPCSTKKPERSVISVANTQSSIYFNNSTHPYDKNTESNIPTGCIPLITSESSGIMVDKMSKNFDHNNINEKQSKKLARKLKREKRNKRKLLRAKIDLAPPPGVDLDEFLLQQVASIKMKLQHTSDEDRCDNSLTRSNSDFPDLIKDQVEIQGLLGKVNGLNTAISTVLHADLEGNMRKVFDCESIDKDFQSLPEFSPPKGFTRNNLKIRSSPSQGNKSFDAKSSNKSIAFRLKNNRARTPQSFQMRRPDLKSSKVVEKSTAESELKSVGKNETSSSIVISNDEIKGKALSPVVSAGKFSSSPSKSGLPRQRQEPAVYSDKINSDDSRIFRKNSPTINSRKLDVKHLSSRTDTKRSDRYRFKNERRSPPRRMKRSRSKSPCRSRKKSESFRRRSNSTSPKNFPWRKNRLKSPTHTSLNRRSRLISPKRSDPSRKRYVSPPYSYMKDYDSMRYDEGILLNVHKAVSPPKDHKTSLDKPHQKVI